MSFKTLVRFLIALLLTTVVFSLLLPVFGIPRAMLYPPPYVYQNATGKTQGVVLKKFKRETSDPFHVGDRIPYVQYQYHAPYTPTLFGDPKSDPRKLFTGVAIVSNDGYQALEPGMTVPVKYERTYPIISGINLPYGGQNQEGAASLFSAWIGWALVMIVVAFFLGDSLQRFLLRESY